MNFRLQYLLLIPPLVLAQDFLPEWFVVLNTVILTILSLYKLPKLIAYINISLIYLVFQSNGIRVIPETMIPALATLLVSQIIISRAKDKLESYLGFLWFGIFALFSAGFYYLVYSVLVFLCFIILGNGETIGSTKTLFKNLRHYKAQLLFTAISAITLFIFFPRFHSFLPSANNNLQGNIGYSKSINNSETTNLSLSSGTAFYASIDKVIDKENLYWRGRVHTNTDGYNWKYSDIPPTKENIKENDSLKTVRVAMKYEQDFEGDVILLDTPLRVLESNARIFKIQQLNMFKMYIKKKKAVITSESRLQESILTSISKAQFEAYLQLPPFIPAKVKSLAQKLNSNTPFLLIQNFERYLQEEGFTYSLTPGPTPTLVDFINRKKGYCTHFASLLGIILRVNKIPTRLVSGFQGGIYNEVGGYFEVKSNDAHAWVEYYYENRWNRIDPTSFVSPERINLGGEAFLTRNNEILSFNKERFPTLYRAKQFLDNLNYQVSLFFDNYDRTKQEELYRNFNISRKAFYFIGVLILIIVLGFYYFLVIRKSKQKVEGVDKYLKKLESILKLAPHTLIRLKTIHELKITSSQNIVDNEIKELVLEIINAYQILKYSKHLPKKDINDLLSELESNIKAN